MIGESKFFGEDPPIWSNYVMTDGLDSTQPVVALTRRELRERERAAERAAMLAQQAANSTTAEVAAPEAAAEVAPQREAPALTRREIREAERAAEREQQLRSASAQAAQAAARVNPELFAAPQAPAEPSVAEPANSETVTNFKTEIVETLNPATGPISIAPIISLEDVRAARNDVDENSLPEAPVGEPEIPAAFLRASADDATGTVLPFRGRGSGAGKFGGSMVALSFLAGTVMLGAGSAAAIGALSSSDAEVAQADAAQQAAVEENAQSLSVSGQAVAHESTRTDDATAVTSIGTAAAANLAAGVKLPDSTTYENDITANVQWPFPMGVQLTDGYGPRNGPAGTSGFHGGQDFTPGEGTPIGAIADGVVKKVDLDGASSLGNYIEVEHVIEGQHVTSLYSHLDPSTIKVEEGDEVQVGDELAGVGNTGISTGPHLHLEIHVNGDYVDPITFLKKVNVAGVETSMPTELTATVGLGSDTKLESSDSTALVEDLFVSKISN